MRNIKKLHRLIAGLLIAASVSSCEKLITADEPTDTITTSKIFENDVKAEMAIAGTYNYMINGLATDMQLQSQSSFAAGLAAIAGGYSSGELINFSGSVNPSDYVLVTSKLLINNSLVPMAFWNSAYGTIYNANTVIDGISGSVSEKLSDSVRKEIIAEAKFLRAFSYFYLTNFFGELPLALSSDFNYTAGLSKSSVQDVYKTDHGRPERCRSRVACGLFCWQRQTCTGK